MPSSQAVFIISAITSDRPATLLHFIFLREWRMSSRVILLAVAFPLRQPRGASHLATRFQNSGALNNTLVVSSSPKESSPASFLCNSHEQHPG